MRTYQISVEYTTNQYSEEDRVRYICNDEIKIVDIAEFNPEFTSFEDAFLLFSDNLPVGQYQIVNSDKEIIFDTDLTPAEILELLWEESKEEYLKKQKEFYSS